MWKQEDNRPLLKTTNPKWLIERIQKVFLEIYISKMLNFIVFLTLRDKPQFERELLPMRHTCKSQYERESFTNKTSISKKTIIVIKDLNEN